MTVISAGASARAASQSRRRGVHRWSFLMRADAVAGALDDAAVMSGDGGIGELMSG